MTFDQKIFDFDLPAAMRSQDFIVSEVNRTIIGWFNQVEDWSTPACVIKGEAFSGKSHLCRIWQELYQAIPLAVKDLSDEHVIENLEPGGFYFIDDVDVVLTENPALQSHLFHIYNFLFNQDGRLLLTMTNPWHDIPVSLPDLKSRLLALPLLEIKKPSDSVVEMMLVKLFNDRQIILTPQVIKFLIPRLERSYKGLHEAVHQIDALSLKGKRPITIPLVKKWLAE